MYEFIAPDQLSISIGPSAPATLSTDEPICFSFISVSLSGNGFFTWQPLSEYWHQIGSSAVIQGIQQVCRETFPAPEFESLDDLRDDIGELFLNSAEYQSGDWIVSVSESG